MRKSDANGPASGRNDPNGQIGSGREQRAKEHKERMELRRQRYALIHEWVAEKMHQAGTAQVRSLRSTFSGARKRRRQVIYASMVGTKARKVTQRTRAQL